MTKAELVVAIADKAGLNKAQAKEALEPSSTRCPSSLKAGKEVRLVGFGSFVPVKRPAGTARNPAYRGDGESGPLPAAAVFASATA
jgi:DNA-binding protein HU-beta